MEPDPFHRFERWLCHPRFFKAVLLLALALAASTITLAFYSDDYILLCYLAKLIPGSPPWDDLYNFFNGDPQQTRANVVLSVLPWTIELPWSPGPIGLF